MKTKLLIFCVLMWAISSAHGQPEGLRTTLIPETNSLVLGEPLILNAILENTGSEAIDVAPWQGAFQIFIAKDGQDYRQVGHLRVNQFDWRVHRRRLESGGKKTVPITVLVNVEKAVMEPKGGSNYLAITESGLYRVKAKYGQVETEPAIITMIEPQGSDVATYNFIKTNNQLLMHFQFPKEELSSNTLISIRTLFPDRSSSVYRRHYEPIFKPKETNGNVGGNAADNPLEITTRALESQWYDVKGFQRNHPEAHKAMFDEILPLNDQMGEGKFTREEFQRRSAEILKRYIRQHSKPLPPEEWKRRYQIYAKENAERATKQEAQHQEFLKNGARILQETPKPAPRK